MSRRGAARRRTRSARGGEGACAPYARDARYPLDREGRGGTGEASEVDAKGAEAEAVGEERESRFEFVPAPALARSVITLARELLSNGLSSAEVCSLFTHAASTLAQNDDGLDRDEWLELCAELHDGVELERELPAGTFLTSPGGLS